MLTNIGLISGRTTHEMLHKRDIEQYKEGTLFHRPFRCGAQKPLIQTRGSLTSRRFSLNLFRCSMQRSTQKSYSEKWPYEASISIIFGL